MSLYRSYKWLDISTEYTQKHIVSALRDVIEDIMELGDEVFKGKAFAPRKPDLIKFKGKSIEECTNEELKEFIRYLTIGNRLGL